MTAITQLNLIQATSTAFVDVESEIAYWRHAYRDHPAFSPRRKFDGYEPAVRLGIEAFIRDPGRTFEECRDALEDRYDASAHGLDWYEASSAAAAAWHRLARRQRAALATSVDNRPGCDVPSGTALAS